MRLPGFFIHPYLVHMLIMKYFCCERCGVSRHYTRLEPFDAFVFCQSISAHVLTIRDPFQV